MLFYEIAKPSWLRPVPAARISDQPQQTLDCNGLVIPFFGFRLRPDGSINFRSYRLRRNDPFWEACRIRKGQLKPGSEFAFVARYRGQSFGSVSQGFAYVTRNAESDTVNFWIGKNRAIQFVYDRVNSQWKAMLPEVFFDRPHPTSRLLGFRHVSLDCREAGSTRTAELFGQAVSLQFDGDDPYMVIGQSAIPTWEETDVYLIAGNRLRVLSNRLDANRVVVTFNDESTYLFEVIPQLYHVGNEQRLGYWWANVIPIWSMGKMPGGNEEVVVGVV